MTPDQELMVIFGALHLVALVLAAVLFAMFLRSETAAPWRPPEEEDGGGGGGGGGGNDRVGRRPKSPPPGGLPLPDAQPAHVRLRDGHGRLADHVRPERRREHAPQRPRPRVPSGG